MSRTMTLLLVAALAAGNRTSADEPADRTAAILAEALERNPDLLAAREELRALRARPDAAAELPDPMLSVEYQNDGWAPSLGNEDMTMLTVMGSQAIPRGGKRGLRVRLSTLDADRAAEQLRRLELTTAAGARRALTQLHLTRAAASLLAEQEGVWREVEAAANARYSAGQGLQQEVLRAQVEALQVRQERAVLVAEERALVLELNRLRGAGPDAAVEPDSVSPAVPAPAETDALAAAAAASPELRALDVGVERARAALALAKAQFTPDVTLQAGYSNRGGLPPMWQVGASVNLPIRRRRLAAGVAEAEAALRAAEARRASARQLLETRTRDRLARAAANAEIVRLYAESLAPQAQASVDSALAAYSAGRSTLAPVLEALVRLRAVRLAHLRALTNVTLSGIAIEEASLQAGPPLLSTSAVSLGSMGGGDSPSAAGMEMR